jgi:hypothetical protein
MPRALVWNESDIGQMAREEKPLEKIPATDSRGDFS